MRKLTNGEIELIRKYPNQVDWDEITYKILSENFIREFRNHFNLGLLLLWQDFSEDFIIELSNGISKEEEKDFWKMITTHQKISENFIEKHQDKLYWKEISYSQKLSESFIRKFKDKIHFDKLYIKENISEDFILEFQNKLDWFNVSMRKNLSESFISIFADKLQWCVLNFGHLFSIGFIEKFKNKIEWETLSSTYILSEDFIRKYQNYVCWEYISQYQKLSEDFIREFKGKVFWTNICKYQKLSFEFIKEFGLVVDNKSWIYKSGDEKLKIIKKDTKCEINGDYIIAYKQVGLNRYANWNVLYNIGNIIEGNSGHNIERNSMFGLDAYPNIEDIREIDVNSQIIKVKIHKNDLRGQNCDSGIFCTKMTVLT
jgi:hypothetical protein